MIARTALVLLGMLGAGCALPDAKVIVDEPDADLTAIDADPTAIDAEPAAIDAEPAAIDAEPAAIDADPGSIDAMRTLEQYGWPAGFIPTEQVLPGDFLGYKVTVLAGSGTVTLAALGIDGVGSNVRMALYTDVNDYPAVLVAGSGTAPFTFTIGEGPTQPSALASGADYWVMFNLEQTAQVSFSTTIFRRACVTSLTWFEAFPGSLSSASLACSSQRVAGVYAEAWRSP